MKYKKILAIEIIATSLLLSSGTVFAMDWPTIAGKTLNESSGIADIVSYGFVTAVAFGAIIMFVVIMEAGLRMITGENSGQAKTRLRNGIIGFALLLLTYAIINTINSNILGMQSLETPCINGVSAEYTKTVDGKEKKYKICANTSQPSIPDHVEDKGESFTSCSLKAAIGFNKENYQGKPSILFDDQSSKDCRDPNMVKLAGFKSMRLVGKQDGIYLYDKSGRELEDDSPGPLYFDAGSSDLGSSNFDNKTKSINVISNYYQKDASGQESDGIYRGAVLFENPGYRGKSVVVDSNNQSLKQSNIVGSETDLAGKVSSLVSFKKTLKSNTTKDYVYLYAVKDCGENLSKDKDIINADGGGDIINPKPKAPINGECGDANGKNFLSVPVNGLCKAGKSSGVEIDKETYSWSCVGKNKGKTVECSASAKEKKPLPGWPFKTSLFTDIFTGSRMLEIYSDSFGDRPTILYTKDTPAYLGGDVIQNDSVDNVGPTYYSYYKLNSDLSSSGGKICADVYLSKDEFYSKCFNLNATPIAPTMNIEPIYSFDSYGNGLVNFRVTVTSKDPSPSSDFPSNTYYYDALIYYGSKEKAINHTITEYNGYELDPVCTESACYKIPLEDYAASNKVFTTEKGGIGHNFSNDNYCITVVSVYREEYWQYFNPGYGEIRTLLYKTYTTKCVPANSNYSVNGVCAPEAYVLQDGTHEELCASGRVEKDWKDATWGQVMDGTAKWTCKGISGGKDAQCSAIIGKGQGDRGTCGDIKHPCVTGKEKDMKFENGTWTWVCYGASTLKYCSEKQEDGVCGSGTVNKDDLGRMNMSDLCKAGKSSNVSPAGYNAWTWVCEGTGKGKNSGECKGETTEDGECGTTKNECKKGVLTEPATTPIEGYWYWTCKGTGGGKNDNSCKVKYIPNTSIINKENYFASIGAELLKAINEPLEVADKAITIAVENIKKTAKADKKVMFADLSTDTTSTSETDNGLAYDEVENGYKAKAGGMYDICKIEIPKLKQGMILSSLEKTISEECEGLFEKKGGGAYDIISFKMGARAGVLIKGDNENSLYWDMTTVEKSGNCIGDIRGSDIFNTDILGKTVKPKTITVFPTD